MELGRLRVRTDSNHAKIRKVLNKPSLKLMGLAVASALYASAPAQTPFNAASDQGTSASPQVVTGTPTVDLIMLQALGPGVPLRFGSVVPGSERVEHDGKVLRRGVDYQMDYDTGVVYLMRAQKAGQSLLVSYQYDKLAKPETRKAGMGLPTFKFDLLPGGLRMVGAFGLTERTADGNVLTSNLYGLQNSFNMGGGALKGLMLVGERQKQRARSAFEYQGDPGQTEEGQSTAILQNLSTNFNGGKVEANFQDVSTNFTGFSAVQEAGYNPDQVKKERGLQRMGFSLKDVNFGGLKFSNSFNTINDGDESVDWRSLGMEAGGFTLGWNSQRVGQGFKRFKDIAEVNRDQLGKEVGLNRENFIAGYKSKVANLSYTSTQIEDLSSNGIYKREVALDVKNVRFFSFGEQTIDPGFNRFNSLFEPERGQWGREAGLKRQWMALDTAVLGTSLLGLKYNTSLVRSDTGEFASNDLTGAGKGWNFQHISRAVDKTFANLGSLAETEMDAHIRAISAMYQKDGNFFRPEERRFFLTSAGLDRSMTRIGVQPFKGWDAQIDKMTVKGQQDDASVESMSLNGKGVNLRYRKQEMGTIFTEVGSLMEFERQRLGSVASLERSDLGIAMDFGKARRFNFEKTTATHDGSGLNRTVASYAQPKLEVSVATREVDHGFRHAATLVDPEKDLLNSLTGFKERDIKAKWQILPNLSLDVFRFDASSDSLNQDKMIENTIINWKPDKLTDMKFERQAQKNDDPLQVLFAQATERFSLTRNLGRSTRFWYQKETIDFDGTLTQNPDSEREYMALETKLSATTSVKSEQSRQRFDNGDKEDISANTISTDLNKKVGVSVTDVKIDRGGEERDEKKRNYGFWVDFGKGMRLSYGYARQINGLAGAQQQTWGLSPGQIGWLQVNNATYADNRWDGLHTQSFSNIQLASSKPMNLGLFKNVTFAYSQDTAADYNRYARDGQQFSVSTNTLGGALGLAYRSQVAPDGYHGIDRTITYQTDNAASKPFAISLLYKARELPSGDNVMIRNFTFTAKPTSRLQIKNEMLSNPEIPRGDVMLGSLTDPWRVNRWRMDWKESSNLTFGASWEEKKNDLTKELSRVTGLNVNLFEKSGSPLSLFYGVEEADGPFRRRTDRWFVKFDQRPGPNQMLSAYLGNVSYEHTLPDGVKKSNWTVRLDYHLRF